MKRPSLILISAILILAAFTKPALTGEAEHFTVIDVYWGVDQQIEVSAGDVATLTILVRCESNLNARSLEANLSLPEGFEAVGGGDNATTYYAGPLLAGSLIKLEFPIFITPQVERGNYTATLSLRSFLSKYATLEEEVDIQIEVTGKPVLELETVREGLHEGRQEYTIRLSNEGDAVAKNVEVLKVYSASMTAELITPKSLGDLEPGESASISISIFVPMGMKGRIAPLLIEVGCLGPKNVAHLFSETLQLPVKPSDLILPLRLELTPRELSIGKSGRVYIDLTNNGGSVLSEIRLTLTPDGIIKIFGPTVLYIERLSPGETRRVETEVYIPSMVTAPTASIATTVTYFDEGLWTSRSETLKFSLLLRGFIEISLTDAVVIPSTPRPGSPFSITITVTNVGTSAAYAAYATPSLEGLPLKTFGPKSTFIGNIDINLPTTFTVNLQLENTTQRRIILPVILTYMDNLRSLHNVTFNIPINIASQIATPTQKPEEYVGLWTGGLIIIVAAAIIVAAVIIIKVWRRRRYEAL